MAINEKAKLAGPGETVLYDGPVRKLCPMAPNNVNTIAAVRSARFNLDSSSFPFFFSDRLVNGNVDTAAVGA